MERIEKESFLEKITSDIILRRSAESDIIEAFVWYEEQQQGLSVEFLAAIDDVLKAVVNNPAIYPIVHKNIHRVLLRKFPYAIFYLVEEERIIVLACFHQRRDPAAWPTAG